MFKRKNCAMEPYYCNSRDRDIKEYDKVVSSYITYYHVRASRCKYTFYIFSLIKLVLLACLPIFQAAKLLEEMPWFIQIFSSIIFIIESALEILRLKEKWILYRSTCNNLMSIQRQYAGIGKRNWDERTLDYINAVEEVINGEARQWVELSKAAKNDKEGSH